MARQLSRCHRHRNLPTPEGSADWCTTLFRWGNRRIALLLKQTQDRIRQEIQKYPSRRSALVGALRIAQREKGYLPPDVLGEVAALFEYDPNALNELVTFYSMLYREPVGRYVLAVCDSLACYLVGSDRIIDHLSRFLDVPVGGTTADGLFSLRRAECLAACDLGPMMMVDEQYYGNLTPERVESIVNELRARASEGKA
ncbi:MAG: NADH-quinone oxidoreductase subunit NuoE [Chloroflexota bacterium]|nr:MAG: NADH-quinone oxidoreductase subunit NuoE [Chloroflexota bacterium]